MLFYSDRLKRRLSQLPDLSNRARNHLENITGAWGRDPPSPNIHPLQIPELFFRQLFF